MSGSVFEATAPTRVDLAGGTLDIWPIYLFHPGALTVNVAVDRRAWCRVETGVAGVRIESLDTLRKAEGARVADLLEEPGVALVAQVLHALGVEAGLKVATRSRVPAGSGLGGSSALAVAVAAAVSQALGRPLAGDGLWPVVRDAEARCIRVPTGVQDYHAAIHGGVLGVALEPGTVRVERLRADPGRVEECLVLVDAGATRFSGINNWEVFKGQIDGDARVRDALAAIVRAARGLREALEAGHADAVADGMAEEWEARKRLAPGVSSPEIDAIVQAARDAGGAGKVCGAGGGGIVAAWVPPGDRGEGPRERFLAALARQGRKPFPFRVDLLGLALE